ncbi:uncharacterized protein LOC123525512 [Mercenaria mercenaria]|uniref:uncharacterized protein LOC123525512 n=1 Tax=Mercenaria mercenaria TaxID=6596 RepID=UPI00234EEA98|nr:uncharacterized protein LOC123525512 [Mercenaria mercenaria]
MKYFGEIFDKGCKSCKRHFLFKDIIAENIYGLCSLVKFKCSKCRQETTISTSRASGETDKTLTKSPYSVNLKAAIGMIHAGIGETHMNGFLVTLGIPPIHHKTLKKHERKVGKVMEENARDSCARACEEEKTASQACMLPATVTERGDGDNIRDTFLHEPNTDRVAADDKEMYAADDTDTDQITFDEAMAMLEEYDRASASNEIQTTDQAEGQSSFHISALNEDTSQNMVEMETLQKDQVEVVVSQDAAWSKRGRGMNSLSGWGHVIGVKTKKCLNYSTRVKNCAKCNFNSKTGKKVQQHDCRKNWTGSAKSMEPDIVTSLHEKAMDSGMKFIGVIGDEDSSAIKHIREKVNPKIKKFSDFGHIKRNLRRKLETLQKENKSLTRKVTDSFLKNFSYAVKQNRTGTEDDMSKSIMAIVPHMYGNHSMCGHWCSITTGKNEKHANLPKGKDLTDQSLRLEMENLLAPFISNPEKLMTSGTTQSNESLNNVAWSKAPKIRNYNASESFDIRCSAGVAQFNDGIGYVNKVIENSGLSPQKNTSKYTCSKDRQRNYFKSYKTEKKSQAKALRTEEEKIVCEYLFRN